MKQAFEDTRSCVGNVTACSRLPALAACLALVLGQFGCATPGDRSNLLTEADRARVGTVGVVAARFSPEADFGALSRDSQRAAAEGGTLGAGAGASLGAAALLLSCAAFPFSCPAAAPFILAPAAVGGAVGADVSARNAEPAEKIKQGMVGIDAAIKQLRMQQALHDRVLHYTREHAGHALMPVTDPAPAAPDESPSYAPLAERGIETILELSVLKIGMSRYGGMIDPRLRFNMSARARLLRVADGAVMWERDYVAQTPARKFPEWAADNAGVFKTALATTYERLAESIVDELFLIHGPMVARQRRLHHEDGAYNASSFPGAHPGGTSSPTGEEAESIHPRQRLGPAFTLRPEQPRPSGTVESLEPTLRWQAFPRPEDLEALAPADVASGGTPDLFGKIRKAFGFGPNDAGRNETVTATPARVDDRPKVTNVRYEMRLHEAAAEDFFYQPGNIVYSPGNAVYSVQGLSEPMHKPEITLKPCTTYFWTVRARFELDSLQKATPWAGSYDSYRKPPTPGQSAAMAMLLPLELFLYWPVYAAGVPLAAVASSLPPPVNLRPYPYAFETPCTGKPAAH